MAARFPDAKPKLPSPEGMEALAYAYLSVAVKFNTAYFESEYGRDFADSAGNKTHVSTFGLNEHDSDAAANARLRKQIEVLYCDCPKEPPAPLGEFILDLDKDSQPSQIILACVTPKESLAATWRYVQQKVSNSKPAAFRGQDTLAVPNVHYKIQTSFKELEADKRLETYQDIDFLLDRTGATLVSQAYIAYAGIDSCVREFDFTRPFLIAMRRRGATSPTLSCGSITPSCCASRTGIRRLP